MKQEAVTAGAPHALTAHRRSLHATHRHPVLCSLLRGDLPAALAGQHLLRSPSCSRRKLRQERLPRRSTLLHPSGFILAYTYEGQIERAGDRRRFWEARFARIWPVYAVSLLLSSVPSLTMPAPGPALATFAMLQAWNPFRPELAGTWNFVCWTLSVEAFFYLCFPALQRWIEGSRTRSHLLLAAGSIAACIALNTSSRSLGYTATGAYRYIPLPLVHLPEFITGVALGNLFLRRLFLRTLSPNALCASVPLSSARSMDVWLCGAYAGASLSANRPVDVARGPRIRTARLWPGG